MKKPLATLRFIASLFVVLFHLGCNDAPPDDVYKLLEQKAKVKTFPLTILLTGPLAGEAFPDDLKALCQYSSAVCKTLPTAGILRLGPDQYFTFNAIATLNVIGQEGDDEATIAQSVKNQVAAWYLKTKLKDFDSLRSANKPEFNSKDLTDQYIKNNKDSIYFYSANPLDPSIIIAGNKMFTVHKDVSELRRLIDQDICKNSSSISIFYAPSTAAVGSAAPGMYAGDTCVGGSKFEKMNDGKGNLFVGKLIEKNSRSCGFAFPTGIAGDTCIGFSKYQKLYDGRGGFKTGNLLEKNSQSCGYVQPKVQAETEVKVPKTGAGSSIPVTAPVRANQGAAQPVRANAGATRPGQTNAGGTLPSGQAGRVNATTTQPVRINAPTTKLATQPVRVNAATTAPVTEPTTTSTLLVPKTVSVSQSTSSDKRCAKTGDPMCEQDERGNYTGRRIQYCYNNAGKIVRTIVLAKCDGDCRCLGD